MPEPNGKDPRRALRARIMKHADDPAGVVRVSVGGSPEQLAIYCVYRGSKERAIAALRMALDAMEGMARSFGEMGIDEPDTEPDNGKVYS